MLVTRGSAPAAVRTAHVTVLFADLRGYTGLAESLPAVRVVPLLDEFFRVLAATAEKYGGRVFHMAGDGMMVGFGVDEQDGNGAREALACGHAMLAGFSPIAARWRSDLSVDVGIGVGLHSGEVAVGAPGPPRRKATTLVGDTVNVAARLCSRARAGEVLFSCTVAAALGGAPSGSGNAAGTLPFLQLPPISNCADAAGRSTSGACRRRSASPCERRTKLLNSAFFSPRGGIGRRNGLKIRRLKMSSRFNSGRGHQDNRFDARGLAGVFWFYTTKTELNMETAQLIQAASSIASAMAATQYGKFGGMEASRIADIAVIAVKIARAIEVEAIKQP